ncbi:MAG: N-acetylmuramic acid 6-phosphate etherase [Flavobacteriaceae bacterium]|jgi:N-acetylmuramic acid 6-phosphate etherase|tara:strand:+ start:1176 stop:1985 length:810 start_codon:yes stop_codon:yes gene_type:complete
MFKRVTESDSLYNHLETKSIEQLLIEINTEDQKVALAVAQLIPQISPLVAVLEANFKKGGRLFYIGAGTSGRLGILDASEIPPTYGMPHDRVIGLIAGGDIAIRKAVENAEDHLQQAWEDLKGFKINALDVLVGIAASGTTPYVMGGLKAAKEAGIVTACITNNPGSPLGQAVDFPIEIGVGPEYVTGSTRMKSGTAQKLVLNMISTAYMIRVGRVQGNKMVHMQLSNAKLVKRGAGYISQALSVSLETANSLLKKHGSVHAAIASSKL